MRGTGTDYGFSISIDSDLQEVSKRIEALGSKSGTAVKAILRGIGASGAKEAKKAYRSQNIGKGSRDLLYKSITHRYMKRKNGELIQAPARRDSSVLYGYALAKGSTVVARDAKWLTIHSSDGLLDRWARVKQVKLPTKDFIEGPVRDWMKTGNFRSRLDELTQREIDKALARKAKKEGT